jgi:hypothetical protein
MRRSFMARCLAVLVFVLVAVGASGAAKATEVGYGRNFGLGFILGNPTGLSAKWWLGGTNALDFGLGFYGYGYGYGWCNNNNNNCANGGYQAVSIHSDYLWQSNLVKGKAQLDWHLGVGGRVDFVGDRYSGGVGLAVRGPIGLDLMFTNPSFLEIFFEIAPAVYFVPGFLRFEGGLGIRLYF